VLQGFPCFFLSAVLPDIAQRQWMMLRKDLEGRSWRDACWPVDVGDYRFSRASSYAALAAAAVEMGDGDAATELLGRLEEESPLRTSGGVAHRDKASLWAHAVEMMARWGRPGGFRALVTTPARAARAGLFIKDVAYPDLLVAKAVSKDGGLDAVLHPGDRQGFKALLIGGLAPGRAYQLDMGASHRLAADRSGEARLNIRLTQRTELRLRPAD
jgi:hypothetical protein